MLKPDAVYQSPDRLAKSPRLGEECRAVQMVGVETDTVEQLHVLFVDRDSKETLEDAMLAGGRRELKRKGPTWVSSQGVRKSNDGTRKDMGNLFDEKNA
eukprot:3219744-Pyramimonas_sp.AAC.1